MGHENKYYSENNICFPQIMAYTNFERTVKRKYLDLKPENTSKRVIFGMNTPKLLQTQPHEKQSVAIRNF